MYSEVSCVSGDLTSSCFCKRFDRWKLRRELLVNRGYLISPGSLQHEFGDHDAISTDAMTPGIVSLVLVPLRNQETLDSRLKISQRSHYCGISKRLCREGNGLVNVLADCRREERRIELLDFSCVSGESLKPSP